MPRGTANICPPSKLVRGIPAARFQHTSVKMAGLEGRRQAGTPLLAELARAGSTVPLTRETKRLGWLGCLPQAASRSPPLPKDK